MKHYSYTSSCGPVGCQTFTASPTGKSPHGTGSIRTLGGFGTPCPGQAGSLCMLRCQGKGLCGGEEGQCRQPPLTHRHLTGPAQCQHPRLVQRPPRTAAPTQDRSAAAGDAAASATEGSAGCEFSTVAAWLFPK